jgi:hypothetical protein
MTINLDEHRRREQAELETKRDNGATRRSRFVLTRWIDINFDPEKADWLVHGLLPTEGVGVVYGKWKSYKSFIVLDLGVAVATPGEDDRGKDWAGRKTKHGVVVYIAGEGQGGMHKRIEAYKRARPELQDIDLYVVKARPNLGTRPGDVEELVKAIRKALDDDVPVLVIIDTLSRTLAGKDENGEGMRNFADNAEDIASEFGCLVLAVHHEGAADNGRMRGSTVLDAASVATWHVKRAGNGLSCTIEVQDAKDSESGFTMDVTLKLVKFGDERDAERESTLMVDKVEIDAILEGEVEVSTKPRPRKRGPAQLSAFMTAFDIALEKRGRQVQLPDSGPNVRAVSIEAVAPIYIRKYPGRAKEDSKRRAFDRHLVRATDSEILVTGEIHGEPMLWKPHKD